MLVCGGHGLRFLGDLQEKLFRLLAHLIVSRNVTQAIARDTQQPRFRLFGNAVHRPFLQRGNEGFA